MLPSLEHLEGKYEILRKLGEGGMGTVYQVRHRLLEEIRVIKVMKPMLRDDEELSARFVREARVAIQMRHPNIAQLYDFTVDEKGQAYIVMEYIHGVNLKDLLAQAGALPLPLSLEVASQTLLALDYLHRKNFIHRDISPDNVMLYRDLYGNPAVKLIDLGIAKALEGGGTTLTATGLFIGKVRYSSPEQLSGSDSEEIDGRSDLYSFGTVLYELLTGICPIAGDSISSWMAGHLVHPPRDFTETDPEGKVPPDLRRLVLQALAKKPDQRMASAEEFRRAILTLQGRYPLTAGELQLFSSWLENRPEPGVPIGKISSTQDRLDRQFPPGTTPARAEERPRPERLTEKAERPPRQAPPAATEPTGKGKAWMLVAGVLAALLVAAVLVYTMLRPEGDPPAVPTGVAMINALPWGEVMEVRNGDGEVIPLAEKTYTPTALTLPPGKYRIAIHHPDHPEGLHLEVEVQAGQPTHAQGRFHEVTAEELLRELGW